MAPPVTDRLSPIAPSPLDDLPDPAQRVMELRRYVIALGVLGAITIGLSGVVATGVLAALGHRISVTDAVINGVPGAGVALVVCGRQWRNVLIGFRDALPVVGDVHRVRPQLRGVLAQWQYLGVVSVLAAVFVAIGLLFGGSALQLFPIVAGAVEWVAGFAAAGLVIRRERAQGRRYLVRIELAEGDDAERELLWEPDPRP